MVVTALIVFLVLDVAWIWYAMKTAPVMEEEELCTCSETNRNGYPFPHNDC